MKKHKDESVFSLPISFGRQITVFGIWVGETIVRKEWKRYRFHVIAPMANIFKVKFPDGSKSICNIDRGISVEIGKPFSFFVQGRGEIELPEVRYILVRKEVRSPSKPPPFPEDALEDEDEDDG